MHNPFEELKNDILQLVRKVDEIGDAVRQLKETEGRAKSDPKPGQRVTKREVAKLLRCSTSKVDGLARKGILDRYYIGRSVRFSLDQVVNLQNASPYKK